MLTGLLALLGGFFFAVGDDFFLDVGWSPAIAVEFHGECALALGGRSKVGGVAEHVGQGDVGEDASEILLLPGVCYQASSAGQVADDGSLKFHGGFDLDGNDGLEQCRLGFFEGTEKGLPGTYLKGQVGRVYCVVGTVLEQYLDPNDFITGQGPFAAGALEAFIA